MEHCELDNDSQQYYILYIWDTGQLSAHELNPELEYFMYWL